MQPSTKNRRELLARGLAVAGLLAGAGMLPVRAQAAWNEGAFAARTLADAVKALGGSAPVASGEISITGPDIAENGAAVPVEVSTSLTGASRLLLLVEKNPNVLAAVFELSDKVEARVGTQVKMDRSSTVYAVAMLGDGRVLFAHKEIKVALGECQA